jgi:hypothetical protein
MSEQGSAEAYEGAPGGPRPLTELLESRRETDAGAHSLVEKVNATSRQLVEAAERFAEETMRALEGLVSRTGEAAGESREMAAMAGRAADEARRHSESMQAALESVREQVRAEAEAALAAVRAQVDEALGTVTEAVAQARRLAEEGERRGREVAEQVEQYLSASREAATAAESAAAAARLSADSIAEAASAAHHDGAAATQLQETLAASREAAQAAERAAQEARSAALEAMNYAAEARAPTGAGAGNGASALIERLEADYRLLVTLVQELHDRLAGQTPATGPATEVIDQVSPAAGDDFAPETPVTYAPDETPSDAQADNWQAQVPPQVPTAWPADEEPAAGPPLSYEDTNGPESRQWEGLQPEEGGEPEAVAPSAVEEPPSREPIPFPWSSDPRANVAEPAAYSNLEGQATAETPVEQAWPQAAGWTGPAWAPSVGPREVVAGEEVAPTEASSPPSEAAAGETGPQTQAAPALAERVSLVISPVPDFDHLLRIDAALGKMACVENVTLVDYAGEEVTFRLQMARPTPADSFTAELSLATGDTLAVVAVEEGMLKLSAEGART